MSNHSHLALVVRGGKSLSKGGALPTLDEVEQHLVVVSRRDFVGLCVIESSTGPIPDGWNWVRTSHLQSNLPVDVADKVGRALLCA